jgi:hypothetical protein
VVQVDYMVRSREGTVEVDIPDPGAGRAALIDTIEQCCEGTCDCPTDEVVKVAQVSVDSEADGLHLTLEPRNGEALDIVEIDRAVRWSIDRQG